MDNSFSIDKQIKNEKLSTDNNYLYFYRNMYEAFFKLKNLYQEGYNRKKTLFNICKNNSISGSAKEIIELTSIIPCILSLLIGLNREDLQDTNSKVSNRGLFQYGNYESDAKLIEFDNTVTQNDFAKKLCAFLNFNSSGNGPFPYMLEINTSDGRERPYDCMTKIRNALEHAGYFQKKGDVHTLNIFNLDDNDNITFEGRLLEWPFRYFIEDYYGIGLGVASELNLFQCPNTKTITTKQELYDFISNLTTTTIKFTKIPSNLTFKGKDALFAKLNSAFSLGGIESSDFDAILTSLENNGLETIKSTKKLSNDEINKFIDFLETQYEDNLYNNPKSILEIINIYKLNYCNGREIANCFNNILRYIDFRKQYLFNGTLPNNDHFNEQNADEFLNFSFKISLILLQINLINYLIECKEFELPDLSQLDISNFAIEPLSDLQEKINIATHNGIDSKYIKEYIVLDTIRNAMAHGGDRIKIILDKEPKIQFNDIYNSRSFSVTASLNDLELLYSNPIFMPSNQIIKSESVTRKS